jgi:type I restriction enzyme S subunit
MFGDVNQTYISIGDACSLITDGTHQTPTYSSAGVKFLSAKNVTSGRIDWTSIKFIPQELHAQLHKRLAPRRGDILLAKNGTTGVCAVVDTDEVFDIYVSLALLRPTEGFNSCFLHAAINSPEAKRQFNAHLKGIGVSNLHLKDIRTTRIPGPELPLQQAFARRISAVERAKDCHRAQLTELDALIASLQHRAFSVQP